MNCLETHPVIQITWSADFGVGDGDSAWCHVVCQDPGRADTPVVYAGGCRESSREFHLWALWVSRNWSISIFGCLMCTDLSMDSNSKDVLVLTSYWHTKHSFCGGGLSIPQRACENEEHSPVFHACSGSSQSFGRRCYRSSTSMTSTSFTGSGLASFCKLLELKFFLVTI